MTVALRGWPISDVERNVRLSEGQRVSFYELVAASLKTADTLASTCPADDALTPTRRLEVLRQRLAAVRQATVAIRPALLRFFGALDQQQKVRFAGLTAMRLPLQRTQRRTALYGEPTSCAGSPKKPALRPVRRRQRPLRAFDLTHVGHCII